MKCLAVLVCLVAAASAVSFYDLVKEEWEAYKMKHKKQYSSEVEDKFRMKIYAENKHKIAKHNQRFERGLEPFSLEQNKYGDMLHQEFVHTMNGFNKALRLGKPAHGKGHETRGATFIPPAHVQLPDQVDWRKKGAVTEVKDQGKCGSCWSFSTTGALEGQHFRKTGYLVSLSEQNLIDCSTKYGNNGCNGGLMDNAFKYIKDNGGIDTETTYPYEGIDDNCRYNAKNSGADDTGFVDVPAGDEQKLMAAVATVGPVSVAIDASQESFQFYHRGVYFDENCSNETLDHGAGIEPTPPSAEGRFTTNWAVTCNTTLGTLLTSSGPETSLSVDTWCRARSPAARRVTCPGACYVCLWGRTVCYEVSIKSTCSLYRGIPYIPCLYVGSVVDVDRFRPHLVEMVSDRIRIPINEPVPT